MSQLVESIRILNGRVYNIHQHNKRFNQTRFNLYGISNKENLRHHILVPEKYKKGLVKCRLIYDQQIKKIEFHSYHARAIRHLKLVRASVDYQYKWTNREALDKLYMQKQPFDDILIVKDDRLTDTYYGNIALYRDGKWYTPKYPLLKGTQRAKLLLNQKIFEKDLKSKDLIKFTKLAVFNAMRPFGEVILPIKAIIQ